jgi:putative ABC transport system ATP-binding protein
MNIIGLLDHPTSGEYKLDDQIVSTSMGDRAQARLRSEFIGFIFQTFNLLPNLDVLANVELPATYMLSGNLSAKKRATELLNTVGLDHRLHHRPNQLSGGERQRVAIARALMNQPSIILADEPTGNLDSKSGDEIIGLLQELNKKGTTLLLVTHNDDLAKKAGKIIRMKDGRIV